jgi:hypothetical protein
MRLPVICAWCKKHMLDKDGNPRYIESDTEGVVKADFSSSICAKCRKDYFDIPLRISNDIED